MKRNAVFGLMAAVFVGGFALSNSVYVVDQNHEAIVLRFGKPVAVVNKVGTNDPGLKFKAPFVETIVPFDKRNQALDAGQEEVIAADQYRLIVDGFVRYRIDDPLQYYRALGDVETTAHDRLGLIVNSSLRQVLGAATSTDIISGQRSALMAKARDNVAAQTAQARLGVSIIDLRIKRAELPDNNRAAVYRRMQTARQQDAAQIKGLGDQQKQAIIADADKQATIIRATAHEQAETLRGEGDAKRAALFADSFGRDPRFAAFYRSMQAYEAALGAGDTTMVLSPDSEFFKYFKQGAGK